MERTGSLSWGAACFIYDSFLELIGFYFIFQWLAVKEVCQILQCDFCNIFQCLIGQKSLMRGQQDIWHGQQERKQLVTVNIF